MYPPVSQHLEAGLLFTNFVYCTGRLHYRQNPPLARGSRSGPPITVIQGVFHYT